MGIEIKILTGPVTVAYRKVGARWHSVALEFDIIGMGATRELAFQEMRELVNEYLFAVIQETGPVEFFHFSDPADYRSAPREHYKVAVALTRPKRRTPSRQLDLPDLHRLRNRIRGLDLIPAV